MNPVTLVDWLTLDEAAFLRRFRGTSLGRAGRSALVCRAAIALGSQPDPRAAPAIRQHLDDADPAVRATCAWALARYESL
jgi:epoxyqueuosine reductase QueG